MYRDFRAGAVQADVVSSIEQQAQGTVSRALFARIETELDALRSSWERPRKTSSKDTGFESAVPQNGTCRAGKIVKTCEIGGLLPDALSFRNLFFAKKRGDQIIRIRFERHSGMKRGEPIPDLDGVCSVAFTDLVENCSCISFG